MERMLVGVFDNEDKATEASRELMQLAEDGEIGVYAHGIVTKDSGGATTIVTNGAMPEGAMGATAVGAMLGMLGGPAGLAAGAISGLLLGATTDLAHAHVDDGFVDEVAKTLERGKAALVAEIYEESTEAVDARMSALGGRVIRRPLSNVVDAAYARHVAARRAAWRKAGDKLRHLTTHSK